MVLAITRLRVAPALRLPAFLRLSGGAIAAATGAAGFRDGGLLVEGRLVFWTVTRWDDADCLQGFVRSSAHGAAMARLADLADEAASTHAPHDGAALPSWAGIHDRLRAGAIFYSLPRASADHAARILPPLGRLWLHRRLAPP